MSDTHKHLRQGHLALKLVTVVFWPLVTSTAGVLLAAGLSLVTGSFFTVTVATLFASPIGALAMIPFSMVILGAGAASCALGLVMIAYLLYAAFSIAYIIALFLAYLFWLGFSSPFYFVDLVVSAFKGAA